MIHTAKQLKDKVKNMSGGNSEVAQALIRTYFMERFLERVSVSEYRNNFILKGGMLVASIVGVDMRATMDIDTTVKALPLNEKDARAVIERIGELQLEDGITFKIKSVKEIMEDFDYPGIRMMIEANLERMRQPFKRNKNKRQEQVLKKNPLRDSEIPIVLEDFLLKKFNIQEFVFSFLTLKVTVITTDPEDITYGKSDVCYELIRAMQLVGINVITRTEVEECFAVIDDEIVWHGGMNLLGKADVWDNLMRIRNSQVATELLEIALGCSEERRKSE